MWTRGFLIYYIYVRIYTLILIWNLNRQLFKSKKKHILFRYNTCYLFSRLLLNVENKTYKSYYVHKHNNMWVKPLAADNRTFLLFTGDRGGIKIIKSQGLQI